MTTVRRLQPWVLKDDKWWRMDENGDWHWYEPLQPDVGWHRYEPAAD